MTDQRRNPKNILVVQLARFGDFLQTTPLLAALKADSPGRRISVLVDRPNESVAAANPDVDEVIGLDLGQAAALAADRNLDPGRKVLRLHHLLDRLSRRSFDRVINLNTSRPAALISGLFPAESRQGPCLAEDRRTLATAPWADFIMNLMRRRRLIRFNLVDLLASYAGIRRRPVDGLRYLPSPGDRQRGGELLATAGHGPLIGFQVGSRHVSRQWPPERFAELAEGLINERGAAIVLLGTAGERPIGREVLEALGRLNPDYSGRVIDLMGRTSIGELAGVLERLDLLITTDTGTMHMAAAVGAPILALFMGPAFCHETGPYGSGHVILQASADCSPCMENEETCQDWPCRKNIHTSAALDAARWVLDGRPQGVPDPGPGVDLLVSRLDRFGAVFTPVNPGALTGEQLLAMAFREAGRAFIRPAYRPVPAEIAEEISRYPSVDREAALGLMRDLEAFFHAGEPERRRYSETGIEILGRILAGLRSHGETVAATRLLADMIQVVGLGLESGIPVSVGQNRFREGVRP